MKLLYKLSGKISLLCYVVTLYYLWHMCQYGGVRSHLPRLAVSVAGFVITFLLWLFSKRHVQDTVSEKDGRKKLFRLEVVFCAAVTIYFGGRIFYSAIPYNGALSWKVEEWLNKKEITLEHNNFWEDGAEGLLSDLDRALDLPEELYIANQFELTFDADGEIQSVYTFLYGKTESGETGTYLIDYDSEKSDKISVWIQGEANEDYDEDMRLAPMLAILSRADCNQRVKEWQQVGEEGPYEILYYGRRSFGTEEGLVYLPGDADGDSRETGEKSLTRLREGGEMTGFEVSLHIPGEEGVTPVRYMMEPEYTSQEELNREREDEQAEEAKNTEGWTIDQADGTMYFFLNQETGWRLTVADAAAGSRFYRMEKTEDGGAGWQVINEDPFLGSIGVTEGLVFFDENLGFAGLTGASCSYSGIYVTRDGGVSFEKVELPMDRIAELPEEAEEYGYTVEDYDYVRMPEKKDSLLSITVTTDGTEREGILFQSEDNGLTWECRE